MQVCGNERKQAPGNGYSNLLSHLSAKHADFKDKFTRFQRMGSSSIKSFGFVSEKTNHLYQWMRWVVARNLPLCEVENPITRSIVNLCPTTSQTLKLAMEKVAAKWDRSLSRR